MIYNYTHLLFQLFARILFFYCGIIRQKMIQVIHLWPICKMHQYLLVMLETSRKDRDIIMLCYFVCHCPHQRYYNMPIATPGYPSNTTSALTPPIGKSTSLVFDSYFGQDSSKGKRMHMLTRPVVIPLHMIHVHIRIHPIHLTARDIMRHHEAYYFNWNNTVSKSW
jgi:hypothetical protein